MFPDDASFLVFYNVELLFVLHSVRYTWSTYHGKTDSVIAEEVLVKSYKRFHTAHILIYLVFGVYVIQYPLEHLAATELRGFFQVSFFCESVLFWLKIERVLNPRYKNQPPETLPVVSGGKQITEKQAIDLRSVAFGTAACTVRSEWLRTALVFRPPDQPFSYGLHSTRNSCRSLLSALQAHVIKWLLFVSRESAKDINKLPSEHFLKASEERQEEALWQSCSEIIWRCGTIPPTSAAAATVVEGKAIVPLPTHHTYVQHSSQYYQDGVTEKMQLFEFKHLEDLQIFFKQYLHLFEQENGAGALLLLYAALLTRGLDNVKKDLDGKLPHLVSSHPEGSMCVVTLFLTGRATPYLHNGIIYVGDEEHYAMPQYGILTRSRIGILVWHGSDDSIKIFQQPGSRLKTPAFPIWVTFCAGHYGVLFNTNRELLRNYHAEKRFDIHYYTCGGCHVFLSVDSRALEQTQTGGAGGAGGAE